MASKFSCILTQFESVQYHRKVIQYSESLLIELKFSIRTSFSSFAEENFCIHVEPLNSLHPTQCSFSTEIESKNNWKYTDKIKIRTFYGCTVFVAIIPIPRCKTSYSSSAPFFLVSPVHFDSKLHDETFLNMTVEM